MRKVSRAARASWLATSALLALVPAGCGEPAVPPDQAASIPVQNPSADNKLKDVNLQNEYQFKEKIGGMSTPGK
jgi:hypothetical protein